MSLNSPPQKGYSWRQDLGQFFSMLTHFFPLWIIAFIAILAGVLLPDLKRLRVGGGGKVVVVYASQDEVYAEPILQEFTRQTGIKVKAIYDSEAVKTVGLANRLLAERARPRCDVFWNNEELRTRQLEAQNVFRETNAWVAFGYRSRRMAINTNRLSLAAAPKSLLELTNQSWRGKVALAYPFFGTTSAHFLALRQRWGEQKWREWCRALQANHAMLVDGNSVAARQVARGEAWVGLTDSDDIAVEQREGLPLTPLPLNGESLLIPNTVAVLRGAPHPREAQQLFEFLQSRPVVESLLAAGALEGPTNVDPPGLPSAPDWPALLRDLDSATASIKEIFLR
jgi:iron(III) transport system substrate-binding protein